MILESQTLQILFRIHHSLGDGVALLRLFLETIADREPPKKDLWSHCVRVRQELRKYLDQSMIQSQFERKVSIWRSLFSFDGKGNQKLTKRLKNVLRSFGRKIIIFVTSPASIVYQGFFKKIDENILHQKQLSGEKVSLVFIGKDRFANDFNFYLSLISFISSVGLLEIRKRRRFQFARHNEINQAKLPRCSLFRRFAGITFGKFSTLFRGQRKCCAEYNDRCSARSARSRRSST